MSRKQRIIVSITGIILVSLILIGLTYAYFLTKIKGNTNTKSISVTTANLLLEYADINDELISDSKVEPGKSWTKTFVATNKGNKTVTYGVALENVVNQLERKSDLVYTLECKQYLKSGLTIDTTNKTVTGTTSGTCNGVSDETTFPSIGTILVQNSIAEDKAQVYTLVVTYKDVNEDQSVDMNKTFSAKANIVDPNTFSPYGEGTLASVIINNAKNATGDKTIYQETPTTSPGNTISTYKYVTTNESGIEKSSSTMSVSSTYQGYYWVYGTGYTVDETSGKFTLTGVNSLSSSSQTYANMYSDLVGKYLISSSASSNSVSSTSTANPKTTSNISNVYKVTAATSSQITYQEVLPQTVGIEKTLSKAEDDYGDTYYFRGKVIDNYVNFANMCWRIVRIAGDGSVKLILEDQNATCDSSSYTGNWSDGKEYSCNLEDYTIPFQTSKLSSYLNKLKAGDWCYADIAYASKTDNTTPLTKLEVNELKSSYNDDAEFYYDSYVRLIGKAIKEPTNRCNGTVLNKYNYDNTDLYVGTLTADEIVYAGATDDNINYGYYLLNDYQRKNSVSWWTLSPSDYHGNESYYLDNYFAASSCGEPGITVRPAVTLSSSIQITKGDGTQQNPYIVE